MVSLLLALLSPAQACGRFVCQSITEPIDPAGEQIIYHADDDKGTTQMDVLVSYEGPAETFAWIVPVPSVPDLDTLPPEIFGLLDGLTTMQFQSVQTYERACPARTPGFDDFLADTDAPRGGGGGGGDQPPADAVEVHDRQEVGPYEAVTLSGDSADAVVQWLQDHDYFLTDDLIPALAPYVAEDQLFVALRLAKGKDTGDLAPLSLTWKGTRPAIPLRLTAIAAQPDMPVDVFLLGRGRAVPTNYLHITLNPFRFDWFRPGNIAIDPLLSQAADEAGGHGFHTQSALRGQGVAERITLPNLHPGSFAGPRTLAEMGWALADANLPDTDLLSLMREHLPIEDLADAPSDADY